MWNIVPEKTIPCHAYSGLSTDPLFMLSNTKDVWRFYRLHVVVKLLDFSHRTLTNPAHYFSRTVAVFHPFTYQTKFSNKIVDAVIFGVYVLAVAVNVPAFTQTR